MPTASAASTSSGSISPATGFRELDQIVEDDPRKSPMREAHLPSDFSTLFPPTSDGGEPAPDYGFLDHQLISPTSRLSRLPTEVPSLPQPNTTSLAPVAISGYQNSNTSNTSQDVHHLVNSSTSLPSSLVTRAGLTTSTETPVSSFTQPLTQHVINHPIRRPRTSNIFQSPAALAVQYGIPQILPPAPSTAPRTSSVTKPSAPVSPDFSALRNNYLTMLNNNPNDTSTSVTAHTVPIMSTPASLGLNASDIVDDFINMSPDFREQTIYDWNTPVVPELDAFDPSPMETPLTDFLTTPNLSDEPLVSGPNISDFGANLFHHTEIDTWYGIEGYGLDSQPASSAKIGPDSIDFNHLYAISPYSPPLDSFDTFSPTVTVVPPAAVAVAVPTSQVVNAPTTSAPVVVADAPTTSRRAKATGIRKGITPDSLLDVDAPTQPRKYVTPSSTSRKEVPAVFARKRTRSDAFEDEEDELDSAPPDDTERTLIEAKRRQNTVAARRSRRRKLEQVQTLERAVKVEQKLKEIYKERAEVVIGMLRSHGIPVPDFPSEEETLASLGEF